MPCDPLAPTLPGTRPVLRNLPAAAVGAVRLPAPVLHRSLPIRTVTDRVAAGFRCRAIRSGYARRTPFAPRAGLARPDPPTVRPLRLLVGELAERHRDDRLPYHLQLRLPARVIDPFEGGMTVAHAMHLGADVGFDQQVLPDMPKAIGVLVLGRNQELNWNMRQTGAP